MQLSQLTIAVVAGSVPPRQWALLSIPGQGVFAFGMVIGVMAVVLARGWLWWRGPRRPARAAQVQAQPVSAPVSVAVRPLADAPAPAAPDLAGSKAGSAEADPEVVAAARRLLTDLENRKVTLATGKAELVDRFLSAAVAELASGLAPCGECDLVLVGFTEPRGAGGLTMRRGDVGAALDLLAARAVTTRRRVTGSRNGGLTVLVSRVAPTPAELAMLADLVNEPGRTAALLPAIRVGRPPAAASVLELSQPDDQPAAPVATVLTSSEPEPEPAAAASLRIGLLGQLTINGQPGALLPAQTQLIVALALHGKSGLPGKQLCHLLGSDADHPKPADSLRQLIARTRRQLGQAGDGGEWIEHLGHGRYALHKDARLDWHEFELLTDQGTRAKDAGQLAAALAMIRGQPFAGCYYWWLDIELIDRIASEIVAAAATLAELKLAGRDPAAAARAARVGLVADATCERLWRLLMRAEHAAGNLAGVREAWSRCIDAVSEIAADGEPDPATTSLYRQLLVR